MHSRIPLFAALVLAFLACVGLAGPGTGGTGATGATTGIGVTGGTTGATGGGPTSSGTKIYIVDISEDKSADTYGYFSSTWQTRHYQHVAGMQFHIASWTYAGSWDAHVTSHTHSESLFVEAGTEMGVLNGDTIGSDTAPGSVAVKGFDSSSSTGHDVRIQTSEDADVIPSGRTLAFWIKVIDTTTYDNAPPSSSTSWTRYAYDLIKLTVNDASVDTRRTYGQPNTGGEYPADANAPLRYVKFGDWFWKGGLFLGNMPAGGKDASGTARIQFYPQGGSSHSDYIFASLVVFDKGKPGDSAISGAVATGAYIPRSNDTNLSVGEGSLTWENKWDITPGAVASGTDWDLHPISNHTLTNGNSDNYVSFAITPTFGSRPAEALTGVCLATVSEAAAISGNSTIWHYFASKEFQDTGLAFPRNDCAPHVWLIEESD